MKRLLIALACAFALAGAYAQEPAKKAKAKKAERAAGTPKQKIWISPSDRERLDRERAAARAKKKASAK